MGWVDDGRDQVTKRGMRRKGGRELCLGLCWEMGWFGIMRRRACWVAGKERGQGWVEYTVISALLMGDPSSLVVRA